MPLRRPNPSHSHKREARACATSVAQMQIHSRASPNRESTFLPNGIRVIAVYHVSAIKANLHGPPSRVQPNHDRA